MSTPLISIVDDDESVRTALDSLIRSLGYSVDLFASAQDFLDSPAIHRYACLILDVQMAVLSGLDLQEQLLVREIKLPLIFITAFPDLSLRNRALAAGALAFLSKPFDVHTMVRLLESVVP